MSDITQLRDGKLSPVEFATKVAGEFKDNPLVKAFAPLILSGLQVELTALTKSPTLAALIISSIAAIMQGRYARADRNGDRRRLHRPGPAHGGLTSPHLTGAAYFAPLSAFGSGAGLYHVGATLQAAAVLPHLRASITPMPNATVTP